MTRFIVFSSNGFVLASLFLSISFAQQPADFVALLPSSDQPPTTQSLANYDRAEIVGISNTIDELVSAQLKANGVKPNARATDEVFLRRAYLQIGGRIPTMQEAQDFLGDRNKDKRSNLIDHLLASDAYVSHQFNYWADLLRLKERLMGGISGKPYKDFVRDAVSRNMPYDEFVRALIMSEGPALERGNGATGYYLRDRGMPEDNMSNTVRIFLGTRLECAQCHDHPFDAWTQKDYFRMVAFTGGVRTQLEAYDSSRAREVRQLLRDKSLTQTERQKLRRVLQPLNLGVAGGGTGLARLPDDYQYDDAEPLEIVTAHPIFDAPVVDMNVTVPRQPQRKRRPRNNKRRLQRIPGAKDIASRDAYASWLTSPENPRFALTIANRMWKYAMGIGLIEPVDDLNDSTVASNPELMGYLTEQMVALDFDLKQFLRAIYLSESFQRHATTTDVDPSEPYHFPGPIVQRMSAEQLWDSLCAMTVPNVDDRKNTLRPKGLYNGRLLGGDIYKAYEELKQKSLDEIKMLATADRKKAVMGMMSEAERDARKSKAKINQRQRELRRQLGKARKAKKFRQVRRIQAELNELMDEARETFAFRDFVRASELFSPMRPGHFLREFGQSDREQIDNANSEPAVTQVLALMNGLLEQRIVNNPYSMLMKNVNEASSPRARLDAAFLTILSRYPTKREQRIWSEHVTEGGEPRDVIWVLANTHEFMFIQ